MPSHSVRTIGIIGLADNQDALELDAVPRNLADTLKWLVGESDVAREDIASSGPQLRLYSANPSPPVSVQIDADLDAIYSQLDEAYRLLLPC